MSVRPLAKTQALLERYVVMTPEQRLVVALWIVHAHCVQYFEQTPYLSITSPEKRCGKSRLLEVLDLVVPRPLPVITPSEATIYRTLHREMNTLLLDEVDTIFNPRSKGGDRYEGLRAILNAGNRRGVTVPRCVGATQKVERFNVYGAKVLAGIGVLPDTVTDRSIPIRLQRKTREEQVTRFRRREALATTEPIKAKLTEWAVEHGPTLAEARPAIPEELNDRAQDAVEPLLAIADVLGYGDEARAALVKLLTEERADATETARTKLLADIRMLFTGTSANAILTAHLLNSLNLSYGWSDWYQRGLSDRDLAAMLRDYGIAARTVRSGEARGQGYRRDQFVDAWARYLPAESDERAA